MSDTHGDLALFLQNPKVQDAHATDSEALRSAVAGREDLRLGTRLAGGYVPVYGEEAALSSLFTALGSDFLSFYPAPFSPMGETENREAGISAAREQPFLGLRGQGVVVGIVDTGIAVHEEVFRFPSGESKILALWDQSVDGARGEDLYYGSEYTAAMLTQTQAGDDTPGADLSGHGTAIASLAAGAETADYIGAAPAAYLMVVKLRRMHPHYIAQYALPEEEAALYSGTDVLLAYDYIRRRATALQLPFVLCASLGTNLAGHDGTSPVERYLDALGQRVGTGVVVAAGNESSERRHSAGVLAQSGAEAELGVLVESERASFTLLVLAKAYDSISVGIRAPGGELLARRPFQAGLSYEKELLIDKTRIRIGYYKDQNTLVLVTVYGASRGIWEFVLYGDFILSGRFDAYLPVKAQLRDAVSFMRPVPDETLVCPATGARSVACGSYWGESGTLSQTSSWGKTRQGRMAPDLVAPGVDVAVCLPRGSGSMSGTSAAAALTAGGAALLFEWGIVEKNRPNLDGDLLKMMLIGGARRDAERRYPNIRWGYGELDVYGAILRQRESSVPYEEED